MEMKKISSGKLQTPFRPISRSSGAPLLRQSHQMVPRREQIRQRGHNEQAVAVLHQAAIADLGEAEDALDDEELLGSASH